MGAVSPPHLLGSLEVCDSEDTGALIVWDCNQRDPCDLSPFSYSDGLAAVMNILDMFITSHLTREERSTAVAMNC